MRLYLSHYGSTDQQPRGGSFTIPAPAMPLWRGGSIHDHAGLEQLWGGLDVFVGGVVPPSDGYNVLNLRRNNYCSTCSHAMLLADPTHTLYKSQLLKKSNLEMCCQVAHVMQ